MSIYQGCKDCLVMSHEGNVKVDNVPQNTRRSKVVEIARIVLQEKLNKPLTGLNDIKYYINDDIYKLERELFGDDIEPKIPIDFYTKVNWNDYK